MLEYEDRIYGKIQIRNKLILEIINSKTFQNLKKIKQIGIPNDLNLNSNFSRFEHSMGVYILLNNFKLTFKEQLIGLLHDISHTAFSHTADYIFGDSKKQDLQDNRHHEFISNCEIANILKKYNYPIEEISNLKKHPIIKRKPPLLNADRLDYLLREISYYKNLNLAKKYFNNIILIRKKFIFKNKETAISFAKTSIKSRNHFESEKMTILIDSFSKFLKLAIKKNIISIKDFDTNDEIILSKILDSKDKDLKRFYEILKDKSFFKITNKNKKEKSFQIKRKYRYAIPQYIENKQIYNLFKTNKNYKNLLKEKIKTKTKEINYSITNLNLIKLLEKI